METKQGVKRPDYLILASLIDIVIGSIGFLIGIILIPYLPSMLDGTFIFNHMGFNDEFMSLMMSLMVVSFIIISLPLVVSGITLYFAVKWSKWIHTISWVPSLFMFPIGTIFGIFSIWLVQTESVSLFFDHFRR